jgi:hypothetical protein
MKRGIITRNIWQMLGKEGKHHQTLIITTHCYATVCGTNAFVHKTKILLLCRRNKDERLTKMYSYF